MKSLIHLRQPKRSKERKSRNGETCCLCRNPCAETRRNRCALSRLSTCGKTAGRAGDFAPLAGFSKHTLFAWKKKFETWTVPDEVLTKRIGRTATAVRLKRTRLGVEGAGSAAQGEIR